MAPILIANALQLPGCAVASPIGHRPDRLA